VKVSLKFQYNNFNLKLWHLFMFVKGNNSFPEKPIKLCLHISHIGFFLCLFLSLFTASLYAKQLNNVINIESVNFYEETLSIELADSVQEFHDFSGNLSLEEVIHKNQFHTIEPGRIKNYQENDVYWYRFGIKNISDNPRDIILKTKNRNIVDSGFYQLDAEHLRAYQKNNDLLDGVVVDYIAFGDKYSLDERPIRSRQYALLFRIPENSEHHFYLRWKDKGQAVFEMEVVDVPRYFREQMFLQGYSFLILGFAIGVLIYNFNIFLRTREKLYLDYCIYIVFFIVFLENINGSIIYIWPSFLPLDLTATFVWSSAFLVMFSASRFTSQILLLDERDSEKALWFKALQFFSLLFAFASFFISYQAIEYSTYILSVAVVVLCVTCAFQIDWRYNDQAAKIYLYSFFPIAICIVLVVGIYVFELIAFPFMNEVLRVAFILNLVILSTGLANQIRNMQEKQRNYEVMLIAAKASEHAKSEFFGKMSHEIRTPLNGVIGMAQLLEGTHKDETQKKYIDILIASSKSLMHLVNNIIDFSKVDAGKMKVEEREFDLQEMVLEVEKVFMMRILESGIPLVIEIENRLPKRHLGDVNRIRQILINLLANAYKFTNEGFIKLKITSLPSDIRFLNKNALRFEVIDTGIGIPPEQVESIFEDFTQIYSANQRKFAGAGLGLAICRELSVLLKGEISLTSQQGRGSTFRLDIPLLPVIKETLNEADNLFVVEKNKTLSSKSMLLIDSCKECRDILVEISGQWGMKTGAVASLEEGLANARRSSDVNVPIDLVVVDYHCLELQEGGNHFINALARHGSTKNATILVLVSQANIANQFTFSSNQKLFIIQRQALIRRFDEPFMAAINGDMNYFKNNRPLLQDNLDELLGSELGSKLT